MILANKVMHYLFPLHLPMFTTLCLRNQTKTFEKKGQLSCINVHVCLHVLSRKFDATVTFITGSLVQQNKYMFSRHVFWKRKNIVLKDCFIIFGSLYKDRQSGTFFYWEKAPRLFFTLLPSNDFLWVIICTQIFPSYHLKNYIT